MIAPTPALLLLLACGAGSSAEAPPPALPEERISSLGADSRFGIDYVFPLQRRYHDERWPRSFARTGAGWVNFADIRWSRIEPKPPDPAHNYHWELLDEAVRVWQGQGFHLVFSLRMGKGWFSGPRQHKPGLWFPTLGLMMRHSDRLPEFEHMDAYRAWIRALVERYDGDGNHDMPGLRSPVLHFQVGNEFANPMFWTGTLEDYGTLLRATHEAVKDASPQAAVISNGIRWNDLFHGDPQAQHFEERFSAFLERLPSDAWRDGWVRARRFTEGTVALAPWYDILDAGGNGPYPSASQGYMTWVRRELARHEAHPVIWDMEARSEPFLVADAISRFHPELQVPGGDEILKLLGKEKHEDHARVRDWYRAEQARTLARVFVTRFAAGFEKVFMGMPDDWDRSVAALSTANPFLGLTDREGRPWPAFHALTQLVRHLDGFREVERLQAPSDVALYRFRFDGKPSLWVAWLEEERPRGPDDPLPAVRVSLAGIATPATATAIRTDERDPQPQPFTGSVELGPTPLIIVPQG